jgi:hypothetical protein
MGAERQQGLTRILAAVLEKQCSVIIDGQSYRILWVIGVTRAEMVYKRAHGLPALRRLLKQGGVYPDTLVGRGSLV